MTDFLSYLGISQKNILCASVHLGQKGRFVAYFTSCISSNDHLSNTSSVQIMAALLVPCTWVAAILVAVISNRLPRFHYDNSECCEMWEEKCMGSWHDYNWQSQSNLTEGSFKVALCLLWTRLPLTILLNNKKGHKWKGLFFTRAISGIASKIVPSKQAIAVVVSLVPTNGRL